jgi:hypothetical protein
MAVAMSIAIQWSMRKRFGASQLQTVPLRAEPELGNRAPAADLPLGWAAKVVWAHAWRYVLVAVPISLFLQWCLFRFLLQPSSRTMFFVEQQAVSLPVGILVGVWAMREAISVSYREFRLQWSSAVAD